MARPDTVAPADWPRAAPGDERGEQPAPPGARRDDHLTLSGRELDVDVHLPAAGEGERVAIVAHGFSRTRKRHRQLGEALADAGVTAVVPDLPWVADAPANSSALVELVGKLAGGALGLPPVPRERIVLIGTSAGGFAALLAAAELPGVAGWIGLDPVDRSGSAADAAARLRVPAVVLRGKDSACNLFGAARSIARAATTLVRNERVEGATHCDFESPTTRLCIYLCGGASDAAARRVREITVDETLQLLERVDPRDPLERVDPLGRPSRPPGALPRRG